MSSLWPSVSPGPDYPSSTASRGDAVAFGRPASLPPDGEHLRVVVGALGAADHVDPDLAKLRVEDVLAVSFRVHPHVVNLRGRRGRRVAFPVDLGLGDVLADGAVVVAR